MNASPLTSSLVYLVLGELALFDTGCAGRDLPLSPDTLRAAPNVASVTVRGANASSMRVVHLRNFHFVDGVAADQLETCKAVQKETEELLVHLIEKPKRRLCESSAHLARRQLRCSALGMI